MTEMNRKWTAAGLAFSLLTFWLAALSTRSGNLPSAGAWFPWLDLLAGVVGIQLTIAWKPRRMLLDCLILAALTFALGLVAMASAVPRWLAWANFVVMLFYLALGVSGRISRTTRQPSNPEAEIAPSATENRRSA